MKLVTVGLLIGMALMPAGIATYIICNSHFWHATKVGDIPKLQSAEAKQKQQLLDLFHRHQQLSEADEEARASILSDMLRIIISMNPRDVPPDVAVFMLSFRIPTVQTSP